MADNGTVIIGAYRTSHVFMVVSGGLITTVNNIAHTEEGYLKPKYIKNPKLQEDLLNMEIIEKFVNPLK